MTMGAQAQGVNFGIKGGLDITNMSFDEKVFDTSNKVGWFIGPSVKISLPVTGLGVDISAFYDQKKTEVNTETITMKNILICILGNILPYARNSPRNMYVLLTLPTIKPVATVSTHDSSRYFVSSRVPHADSSSLPIWK